MSRLQFAFAPPTLGAVTLGPDYALTCTLTSRFFLSLRQSIQTSNWGSQYENSQIGNHGTYQNRSGQNSRTVAVTSGGGGGASRGKIGTTASKQSNGYGYNRRSGAFSKRGSLHGHGNGGMGRKPGSDLENQGHGQQLTNLTVISSMHMGSDWERDETPYYDGSDKLDRSDSSPGKPRRFEDDIELNSLGK